MSRLGFCLVLLSSMAFGQDPFALGVRDTPHRTPDEQRAMFDLPPGFEAQLIAAEPEIQKPLNMAFDARGRLWVSMTVEYPYAAPLDKPGRDSIRVIEFDYNTGKATKITTFADGLNIPIGVLPYGDGCIAHSIPNIWFFHDTDGDGVCDKREVLYGPFDHTRDTHGMENAFRRGFDGWIYACHGFNNDSRVKGKDGHEIHMQSGNTFRFKPDGSRIEHYSHGQVNPFGMCFDPLFNIFTADCHSKPITQVLRGGWYPSFGKPHDGLGFVPSMMEHSHGSTAICGLVYVDGENFPPEYRGNLLSGNVMTSRINRNSLIYHGSTIQCKEEKDFLSTKDPWFRPVDLQIGPDGALYIADFYNRIIGHYEVPLPHPGRDRESGRLWRIVYKGDAKETKPAVKQKDLSIASVDELIAEFEHPVLGQRLLAEDELVNRTSKEQSASLILNLEKRSPRTAIHLAWSALRLNPENFKDLKPDGLTKDAEFLINISKMLCTQSDLRVALPWFGPVGTGNPFAQRAAAEALSLNLNPDLAKNVLPLTGNLAGTPEADSHLRYMLRQCLRNNLAQITDASELLALSDEYKLALAPIALAIKTPASATLLIDQLQHAQLANDQLLPYLTHASRYVEADGVAKLAKIVQTRWPNDLDLQLQAIRAIRQGLAERGQKPEQLLPWAEAVAKQVLSQTTAAEIGWENYPIEGASDIENPWVLKARNSADGDTRGFFYDSLAKGETKTGIYRSQPFPLPPALSFWCAGHIGPPDKEALKLNYIRIRDAETHEVLMEARPPRNDTAQRIEWKLEKFAGRRGYLELIDADAGTAYAWLAVGRFSWPALNPNAATQRFLLVTQTAIDLQLKSLAPEFKAVLVNPQSDQSSRTAAATALVTFNQSGKTYALVRLLNELSIQGNVREQVVTALVQADDASIAAALAEGMKFVPFRVQTNVAEILTSDEASARFLLQLVEQGKLSAQCLRNASVLQKLSVYKRSEFADAVAKLTKDLPPASEAFGKLIAEKRKSYGQGNWNKERGAEVFAKNCANCHQIAGKGNVVGPQLDGIGGRGVDRILEDVLDPHRNVDVAFRVSTLVTTEGKIMQGLVRREEGEQLVLADASGKEIRIAKSEVEERKTSNLSLMPNFFATAGGDPNSPSATSEWDVSQGTNLNDLLSFLASQRAKPPAP